MILDKQSILSMLRCFKRVIFHVRHDAQHSRRSFSSNAPTLLPKPLPPRPKINEDDLIENFIHGGGAGGQKINKTSSAVQLIHKPTGIVLKNQVTRSRSQNRTLARKQLAEKLEDIQLGSASRSALKIEKLKKKKRSQERRGRRKYGINAGKLEDNNDSDAKQSVKTEQKAHTTRDDVTLDNNDNHKT